MIILCPLSRTFPRIYVLLLLLPSYSGLYYLVGGRMKIYPSRSRAGLRALKNMLKSFENGLVDLRGSVSLLYNKSTYGSICKLTSGKGHEMRYKN